MKVPPVPESTRGLVLIGSFLSGVTMFASIRKELLFDPFTEKIYIGGVDVEATLRFKNPSHVSLLLLPGLSSPLCSWMQ
jgi:hypothetical protein